MSSQDPTSVFPKIAARPLAWALAMIAVFVVLQIATLNYGTYVNDLSYIRDYRVSTDVLRDSALSRGQVVERPSQRVETPDLWMVRFKLYSIEADEIVSIMALARIRPAQAQFDPAFYQYGGAFLYPLGAWYLVLSKVGLVHVAPFDQMLANPQDMDRVWIAGRAFVLAAFVISAFLLFVAMNAVAPTNVSLAALAIYLFCPASIMFSVVIKPHWYALLWVNAALLIVVCALRQKRLPFTWELLLSVCIGLAVGSVITMSLVAAGIWVAMAWLVVRGAINPIVLVRMPLLAVLVFAASNPYYLLNWSAVQAERAATQGWFEPAANLSVLATFVYNSLFSGFGIAITLLMIAVALWHLLRGPNAARLVALSLLVTILAFAYLTAHTAEWNLNFRYVGYLAPVGLIALGAWRVRTSLLVLCALLTAAQAIPLKVAYFDENSASRSTRFAAAAWINANIPKTDSICLPSSTVVPFDLPPFRFAEYRINADDCRWAVRVERNRRYVHDIPGYEVAMRFKPRLSPRVFPMVWEHINPQITVYRKNG
jgi:hypothetical protein